VYVESFFPQGYWKDADQVSDHQGVFLYPYQYTDLFGTVKEDFYSKILSRLESHHDFYQHVALDSNVLKKDGYRELYDTLNFAVQTGLTPGQLKTLRNELTATVLSAGESRAVRFNHYDRQGKRIKTEILDYEDLDYPLFELVSIRESKSAGTEGVEKVVHDTVYQTHTDTVRVERKPTADDAGSAPCRDRYLWWAIILVLGILLFRERRKRRG
jgi:hypothetical protein